MSWTSTMISSGTLGERIVSKIHDIQRLDAINIFCSNRVWHEQWAQYWSKIQGVYSSIKPIYESLKKLACEYDHNDIPMSFLPTRTIEIIDSSDKKRFKLIAGNLHAFSNILVKDLVKKIFKFHVTQNMVYFLSITFYRPT